MVRTADAGRAAQGLDGRRAFFLAVQQQGRIAAAVAAGGTVVDDAGAPSFTVLADAEGNRACVCTILDR